MKFFIGILDQTNAELLQRWNNPHPRFAAGTDPRSSDSSLLQNLYGGIERAARYDWLNGGRTLIDKTYLKMLWSASELAAPTLGYDRLAANLDSFIRSQLSEHWDELNGWDHEHRSEFTVALVNAATEQLFGSQTNQSFASQLLLYLCPQLPVFPYSEQLHQSLQSFAPALTASDNPAEPAYGDYHALCREVLANNLPGLAAQPVPTANDRSVKLNVLLAQTDWWMRRLMCQQLSKLAVYSMPLEHDGSDQGYLKTA
jgi:hypothetical protein